VFTGIVEEIGTVVQATHQDGGLLLAVQGPGVSADAAAGDSIAVNGVCLTVTDLTEQTFGAYAMAETLARTTLGSLAAGQPVNLERALRLDGRLGGHIVQGHVDAVATLVERKAGRAWEDFVFALDPALARYVAVKGSIAVDGVSLTVTAAGAGTFGVSLIPATLARTTLGRLVTGQGVNVEVDVLAKYLERLVAATDPAGARNEANR
jgi:riboflavin synthase